ncbi:hypothetical protein BJ741DRAFT_629882 [Chytriomyces cf. hyalinus JEL632]|nr:hypothetical protein BJ741DRAFT_629882 [Chytriomyces cf. hyalinus JEL632]
MDVGRESRSSTPPQNHPQRQKQPTASPSESGVQSRHVSRELNHSHDDTPTATAARKPRTIACDRCRKIRKKCDGTRPICSRCSTKGQHCAYTPVRLVFSTSTTTGHPEEEELDVSAVPLAADHLGHTHPHTQNNLTHPQFMKPPAHQTTVSDPSFSQLSCLPFPQHGAPSFPFNQHHATTYPIHMQNSAGHIAKPVPDVLQRRTSNVSGSSGPSKETPMKSTSKAPIHLPLTRPVSCEGCRQQKRKCDKLRPRCSLCITRKVPCTYTITAKRRLEESLCAINNNNPVQTTKKKPMYIAWAPDATTTHTPGTQFHTENPDERNLMTNSNVYTRARIDSIGGGSASGGAGSDGWCPSVSQGSSDQLGHLPNAAVACTELSSLSKSTWLQVMLE